MIFIDLVKDALKQLPFGVRSALVFMVMGGVVAVVGVTFNDRVTAAERKVTAVESKIGDQDKKIEEIGKTLQKMREAQIGNIGRMERVEQKTNDLKDSTDRVENKVDRLIEQLINRR